MQDLKNIPKHIAIIMDGNRRWAKKQGLSAIAGHAHATDSTVEQLIERAGEIGVEQLTFWAFSTENWGRSSEEVSGLMNLFRSALATKIAKFIKLGARLKMIGDMTRFSADIQEGMTKAMAESENNTRITVTFALNYGGRDEILRAIARKISNNQSTTTNNQWSNEEFEKYLDTAGTPDPDLIIRTGGEQRLSGFLLWQSAYSELYFTDTLFPDFTPQMLDLAIEEYLSRQRRYGK